MSTPQAALRAALEKHGIKDEDVIYHSEAAILEAMQQHRAEALEELGTWVENHSHPNIGMGVMTVAGLKDKLAALKTSHGGSLRESEG